VTISDQQETALSSLKELIASQKSEIEEPIANRFSEVSDIYDCNYRYRDGHDHSDIPSRFIPEDIVITRKGECTLDLANGPRCLTCLELAA